MGSTPVALLAGGALVLAGCGMGFFVGRWTASSPELDRGNAISGDGAADLAATLTDLSGASAEMLAILRDPRSVGAAGEQRAPALSDKKLDEVASAVEKMSQRLEEVRRRGGRGSGYPSLAALEESVERKARLVGDGFASTESVRSELRSEHALWTQPEVLDRYGYPVSVMTSGTSVTLTYLLGGMAGARLEFWITGDEVTDVLLTR